jgi:hypothetical protein
MLLEKLAIPARRDGQLFLLRNRWSKFGNGATYKGLKPRIDSMDIVPGIKSPAYRPNEFFRKL